LKFFIKDGDYYDIPYQFVSFKKSTRHMSSKTVSPNLARPRLYSTKYDMLRNEKYTGRVLLQKAISTGVFQINNNGLMNRHLYVGTHEAIVSDELFQAVQQAKQERSKSLENKFAVDLSI